MPRLSRRQQRAAEELEGLSSVESHSAQKDATQSTTQNLQGIGFSAVSDWSARSYYRLITLQLVIASDEEEDKSDAKPGKKVRLDFGCWNDIP
jgi:hypothetical protein